MSQVKIYSTNWCAYCKAEKQFLSENNVAYEDVNVEEDAAAAKEMIDLSNQMGVPVTRITRDDKSVVFKVGFDQDWLTNELKIA
ncbi:glutaredoxin family protein [Candidatus Saccharibacteria bacterium]|nr:glutaredoxin family protein [Candidatus Saccharibacteria bacterium]